MLMNEIEVELNDGVYYFYDVEIIPSGTVSTTTNIEEFWGSMLPIIETETEITDIEIDFSECVFIDDDETETEISANDITKELKDSIIITYQDKLETELYEMKQYGGE